MVPRVAGLVAQVAPAPVLPSTIVFVPVSVQTLSVEAASRRVHGLVVRDDDGVSGVELAGDTPVGVDDAGGDEPELGSGGRVATDRVPCVVGGLDLVALIRSLWRVAAGVGVGERGGGGQGCEAGGRAVAGHPVRDGEQLVPVAVASGGPGHGDVVTGGGGCEAAGSDQVAGGDGAACHTSGAGERGVGDGCDGGRTRDRRQQRERHERNGRVTPDPSWPDANPRSRSATRPQAGSGCQARRFAAGVAGASR